MDRRVSQLLEEKGTSVSTVDRHATVLEAVRMMNHQVIGSLVVTDSDARPIGILTERDVLRQIVGAGQSAELTRVEDVMSAPPITISADALVVEAMRTMTDCRVRHLPVLKDGLMVGLISIGDLMKSITVCLEEDIEQLEAYITGGPRVPA